MKQINSVIIMFMLAFAVFAEKLPQALYVTAAASEISMSADAVTDPVNELIRVSGSLPDMEEKNIDILMMNLSNGELFYSNSLSTYDGVFNFEISVAEASRGDYSIIISSEDYEDIVLEAAVEYPNNITYQQFSAAVVKFLKEDAAAQDCMMPIKYNIVPSCENYLTNRDLIKTIVKIFEIRCSKLSPGALHTVFDNCAEFSQDDAYYISKAVEINLFSNYTHFYPDDYAAIDSVRYALSMLNEEIEVFETFYYDSQYMFAGEGKRIHAITDGEKIDFYYTDKDTDAEKSIAFAVYDKNGRILSVTNNVVPEECGNFCIFYASLSENVKEASLIKAFVWNRNMAPLCEVIALQEDLYD